MTHHLRPRLFSAIAGWVLIVLGMGLSNVTANEARKHVLILNPFSRDTEPFNAAVSAFRAALGKEMEMPVDFDEIPLDLAHFSQADGEDPLVAFIAGRILRHPVDLVVPIGGASVQFVHRHRDRLFANTPVLALAAEPRMVPTGFLDGNATLVTQEIDLPGMIENMLEIQPDTRQIFVVFGSSAWEKRWLEECRRDFQPFSNRVRFVWLQDLPIDEMVARCADLPPRSFIFHGLFLEDAKGVAIEKNEMLLRLEQDANAPVFSPFASEFGLGPVGGRLFQNSEIGKRAARTARRILNGENAGAITPEILKPAPPVFDWRQLRRWNIEESDLPADSVVRFRVPHFWERYRWPIIGGSILVMLQATLIVGLLVNRKRRIQAEAEATLIAQISAKFVNLPANEVDQEIINAERRICELLDLDVAGLWQWTADAEPSLKLTHLHGEVKTPPPDDMRAADFFPWFQEILAAGRNVGFSSLDELPEEAARDRISFAAFGIQSCLALPLSVGGEPPIGALGLNATRRKVVWSETQVERMQMIAQIFTNALARKRADQALRESELRLSLAADAAGAGIWVLDWDKQHFWITDRARAIFGYPPDLLLDMARFEESLHPGDIDRIRQVIADSIASGDPLNVEYRIRNETSGWRWISSIGRPFFKNNGDPERLLGVSMDVTERREEEARIRAEEASLAAGFDLAGLGSYEFNFAEDTCFIDERLHRICALPQGHQPAASTLDAWMGMIHPDDLQFVLSEDARLHSGEADRVSLYHRYLHPDDGIRWLHHFSGVAGRDESGRILRTYGVIRDITQQRVAEIEALELRETLAHTGRVSLIGQLSSALVHELSQPLGSILRNAEAAEMMLKEPEPDLVELGAIIDDILRDDQRAGNVIHKLRSLLGKGELKLQPHGLEEMIADVLTLLKTDAASRHVRLESDIQAALPWILGDRIHLQQVLLNLILNAMDALISQTERNVRVSARLLDTTTVEVLVCDNGPGIPEDKLKQIFEPFFTTKASGMGMGLSVSKTIVEAHKGKITAQNRPDGGACFGFTLQAVSGVHHAS